MIMIIMTLLPFTDSFAECLSDEDRDVRAAAASTLERLDVLLDDQDVEQNTPNYQNTGWSLSWFLPVASSFARLEMACSICCGCLLQLALFITVWAAFINIPMVAKVWFKATPSVRSSQRKRVTKFMTLCKLCTG